MHQLRDDRLGLEVVGTVVVIGLIAHGAVEALDDAIGFWIRAAVPTDACATLNC